MRYCENRTAGAACRHTREGRRMVVCRLSARYHGIPPESPTDCLSISPGAASRSGWRARVAFREEPTMSRAIGLGCLLALLAGQAAIVSADGKGPEPLTKEERARLEGEATRLSREGFDLHGAGRYAEAVKRMEQVLAIVRRLYPAEAFPGGHPHLAQSLNHPGPALRCVGRAGQRVARGAA